MSVAPLVLAIDDEPGILRLIKLELSAQGLRVITAQNGEEGVRMEEEQRPDIVLLDLSMPERDGFEVMRQLRDRTNIPVILLTGKSSDGDKVKGLELGADDYLAKPFSPEELSARVKAVLRRSAGAHDAEHIISAGDVVIDLHRRVVTRNQAPVDLTRTEWRLLQALIANPGRVMLNTELLSNIWGPEYRGDLQYLRVWVSRLRKKLEADPANPQLIKTYAGIGYMFTPPLDGSDDEASIDDDAVTEDEAELVGV
jgi:two-component system, OmpR family, KDP operon response regulator KdpE